MPALHPVAEVLRTALLLVPADWSVALVSVACRRLSAGGGTPGSETAPCRVDD